MKHCFHFHGIEFSTQTTDTTDILCNTATYTALNTELLIQVFDVLGTITTQIT